jgi:hypothetical protein
MKNSFIAFALCVATIASASSFAGDWKKIHQNSQGDTLSIDPESVKHSGDLIQYLEQIVFVTPRPIKNGLQLKIMKTKYAINCIDRTSAPLDYNGLTTDGQIVKLDSVDTANPKFLKISSNPNSPDAIIFNYLCPRP